MIDKKCNQSRIECVMANKTLITIAIVSMGIASSHGATKPAGKLQIVSPTTNKEVSQAKIGSDLLVRVSETDLHLFANKNVTFSYMLSALPKGSKTATSISGKIACKVTQGLGIVAVDGSAATTSEEMSTLSGTQSDEAYITIPDYMPEGVATLTISLTGTGVGTITVTKSLRISL